MRVKEIFQVLRHLPCTQPTQFYPRHHVWSLEPCLRIEPGVNLQHTCVPTLVFFTEASSVSHFPNTVLLWKRANTKGLEVRFDSLKSCSSSRPALSQGTKREHGVKLPGSGPAVGFLQLRPSYHLCLEARHPVTIAISRNYFRLEGTFPMVPPNCRSLAISLLRWSRWGATSSKDSSSLRMVQMGRGLCLHGGSYSCSPLWGNSHSGDLPGATDG